MSRRHTSSLTEKLTHGGAPLSVISAYSVSRVTLSPMKNSHLRASK